MSFQKIKSEFILKNPGLAGERKTFLSIFNKIYLNGNDVTLSQALEGRDRTKESLAAYLREHIGGYINEANKKTYSTLMEHRSADKNTISDVEYKELKDFILFLELPRHIVV